jgi:prepilin-type N-terminal cleavage/methylation domain-containing protein
MTRHVTHARRGFSLPEVLIALVVMALAVAVFGAAFPSASQAISRSKHIDMASDECQKQLDFYRQVGFNSLPDIPSGASSLKQAFTPTPELPGAEGVIVFTWLDGNYAATTTPSKRVRVDATVTWSGVSSDKGSVTLTTLIVEKPI